MDDFYKNPEIAEQIRKDFLRTQINVVNEIAHAIEVNDITAAQLLAHTLKGAAGLLGEAALAELAQKTEAALKEGRGAAEWMGELEWELEKVINKIRQMHEEEPPEETFEFDRDKAKEIFDNLATLLESKRGAAVDLLDDVVLIPYTEELVRKIEDFDFEMALETLQNLRKTLEI